MTPDEKKAAVKTAKIIRATRKSRGWTQIDTSKKIGISQSALSKMESGALIPSVHQWFEFCSCAGIPADSHVQGYLDRLELIQLQDKLSQKDFKVADIYRNDAGSSGRSMSPIIQWLSLNLGEAKMNKLIKEMGVDPDYFVDLGNQINFRFVVDLFQVMKKKGIYKKTDLPQILHQVANPKSHGGLYLSYRQVSDVENLLKTAFSKSSFYEVNFDYQLEEVSQKKIAFSAKPREHLIKSDNLHFAETRDFVCEYRELYFKNLTEHLSTKPAQVKETSCVFKGADRCVHEMTLS